MRVTDITNVCEAINCIKDDALSSFSKKKVKMLIRKMAYFFRS